MNAKFFWAASTTLTVACLFAAAVTGEPLPGKSTEEALRKNYEKFMHALDFKRIVKDYPKAIDNLNSDEPGKQLIGLATLGATQEPEVIPWMVALLDSPDRTVRLVAGNGLSSLITHLAQKRQDPARTDREVLKPLGKNDLDLRPLAWVATRIMQEESDYDTLCAAVWLIRYAELAEFVPDLRALYQSPPRAIDDPARRTALRSLARWGLEGLGVPVPQPAKEETANK